MEDFFDQWAKATPGVDRPKLEAELDQSVPAFAQKTRFLELLEFELIHRVRLGETPDLDEYLQRFPSFHDLLSERFAGLLRLAVDSSGQDFAESGSTIIPESTKLATPQDGFQVHTHQPAGDAQAAELPQRLGAYQIRGVLGQGTFGTVYRAYHPVLECEFAIKLLRSRVSADRSATESFFREAKTLARLQHPGIVRFHHLDVIDDQRYIVMELVEGGSLKDRLAHAPLSAAQSTEMLIEIARGLRVAHSADVIHRDLKPSNLLLDSQGHPKIADFGLAMDYRHFGTGPRVAGTIQYMSPEQALGESHRVDGRTDIFSLGAIYYEMLSRHRPFDADSDREVIDRIISGLPRPLRQIDDSIPQEVERICMKCLEKRMVDRYGSVADLLVDLESWLEHQNETDLPSIDSRTSAVVPKGLRSYDENDADFFLELLPGPRDRHGYPEAIRFWRCWVQSDRTGPEHSVGVVYGPSGCGKSSLIRAGLVPSLAGDSRIEVCVADAKADGTTSTLRTLLTRRSPESIEDSDSLADLLRRLRESFARSDRKFVIVIDQFEQFLHGNSPQQLEELALALRHCDGPQVQALLVVRDDFWLSLKRFLQRVEVPVIDGVNGLLVDLFDTAHTEKTLITLGRSHDRLPAKGELTTLQQSFISEALRYLAPDGRAIPVHLAVFVELVRKRQWAPQTLDRLGGIQGLGNAFLEETFGEHAPRRLRIHAPAIAAVLEALLPPGRSNLIGGAKSYRELLDISGYSGQPDELAELLNILTDEIPLLSPVDAVDLQRKSDESLPEQPRTRAYQLAHDFLVPSIRQWLGRKKSRSIRGRAELLLQQRAAEFNLLPDDRALPSGPELVRILALTNAATRSRVETQMLERAKRRHAFRYGAVACLLLVATVALASFTKNARQGVLRTDVENLARVSAGNVAVAVARLNDKNVPAEWLLEQSRRNDLTDAQRLHYHVALLPDATSADVIKSAIITPPDQAETMAYLSLLVRTLFAYPMTDNSPRPMTATMNEFEAVLRDENVDGMKRFRASIAWLYAAVKSETREDSEDEVLEIIGPVLVDGFELLDRGNRYELMERFDEVFDAKLSAVLRSEYRGIRESERQETTKREQGLRYFDLLLAAYASDHQVMELLVELSTPEQLFRILPLDASRFAERFREALARHHQQWGRLAAECRQRRIDELQLQDGHNAVADAGPTAGRGVLNAKQDSARRVANFATALMSMGKPEYAWRLFAGQSPVPVQEYQAGSAGSPDLSIAHELMIRAAKANIDPRIFGDRIEQLLADKSNANIVNADDQLFFAMLAYAISPKTGVPPVYHERLIETALKKIYRTRCDSGLRSAAYVLLRDSIETISLDVGDSGTDVVDGQWLISDDFAFCKLAGGKFQMGSPAYEPGRDPTVVQRDDGSELAVEQLREVTVKPFAIGVTEVTVAQYRRFFPDYETPLVDAGLSTSADDPAHYRTRDEVGVFCNKLSLSAGLGDQDLSYHDDDGDGVWEFDTTRKGYRLPTSAEWEYACRAGSQDIWYCGNSPELLSHYAWFVRNSLKERLSPVARFLPNRFGLFDTMGNVTEWCADQPVIYGDDQLYSARGGAYVDTPSLIRSAVTMQQLAEAKHPDGSMGFRLALTIDE